MGCDGGTIPRRDELVKVKRKPETKDKTSHLIFQWRYCNLSQQPLRRPIVACGLGRLYNKTSVIEAIITKEALPSHVRSLKDVVELNLTANPEFPRDESGETSPYVCPVTGREMSGRFRFVALWSCGCVFAEKALKEVETSACPRCLRGFGEVDVLVLNPSEEERRVVEANMEGRRRRKKRASKNVSLGEKRKKGPP